MPSSGSLVFCGVRFMGKVPTILNPDKRVRTRTARRTKVSDCPDPAPATATRCNDRMPGARLSGDIRGSTDKPTRPTWYAGLRVSGGPPQGGLRSVARRLGGVRLTARSELDDQPAEDAAGFQPCLGLTGALGRVGAGDAQRDGARLDLTSEAVELACATWYSRTHTPCAPCGSLELPWTAARRRPHRPRGSP
jgi:hypothetical protein